MQLDKLAHEHLSSQEDLRSKKLGNIEAGQRIKQNSKQNIINNTNALGNLQSQPQQNSNQNSNQTKQPWQVLQNMKTNNSLQDLLSNGN
jgi:hypothetical protein